MVKNVMSVLAIPAISFGLKKGTIDNEQPTFTYDEYFDLPKINFI
jgi:hypothetical protein